MGNYLREYGTKPVPQTAPLPGTNQEQNNAGGYSFVVTPWVQLTRFLILGTAGGTYYATERKLTTDNLEGVEQCIAEDGLRVIREVVRISVDGLAYSNDPALFVLAMALAKGDNETKREVGKALNRVARTGTHFLHFIGFANSMRGWGHLMKKTVGGWMEQTPLQSLSYQMAKYPSRDGWSFRDVLRKVKPVTHDIARSALYGWATNRVPDQRNWPRESCADLRGYRGLDSIHADVRILAAKDAAQKNAGTDIPALVKLIENYGLTREMIPTEALKEPDVWEALLPHMPLGALIRSLNKLTALGVIGDELWATNATLVHDKLDSAEVIRHSRMHPFRILVALLTYQRGHGQLGSMTWQPLPWVCDLLDAAFYKAFANVVPTGKRILLTVDVSGSMTQAASGIPLMTCRQAAAAVALVIAATEPNVTLKAFNTELVDLPITPGDRMFAVMRLMAKMGHVGTDCAAPMIWASRNGLEFDGFISITDNETWAGDIHPAQALQDYRIDVNPNAKMVVMAMSATKFSIADPNDSGMLDIVGLSADAPSVATAFVGDRLT